MARPSGEEKARNMASSTGYCYSDVSSRNPDIQTHHLVNQLHNFDSNPEIYNLTAGIEMIGFAPKNLQQHCSDTNSAMWKGILGKAGGASSSKAINESTAEFYNQHEFNTKPDFTAGGVSYTTSENLVVAQDTMAWHENRLLVGDPSLRCVFPCEGNERPSQGLSLSLSSGNPSSIGLQSFELRQQDDMRFAPSSSRDGYYGKAIGIQHQQQMMQDGFLGRAAASIHYQDHLQISSSKYLAPSQELLKEFCNLGTKQSDHLLKTKFHKTNQREDENAISSSKKQSLCSLELLELQKRKAKLLQMLEELDRRYRHYCDQMKGVVSSFEAVAGNGTAAVYSALASQAMSRHFRCLRDGIVDQIKETKKAMGEKDTVALGTTLGETPRLRILDQNLRQQRAFQQMSMMESHPWRPQRGLPERSVSVLRAWLFEHFLHPYPSDVDKHILARQTGLSRSQVSNWFINARVRLWKPMVEEMYMEETKEQDKMCSSDGVELDDNGTASTGGRQNQNSQGGAEDKKPTPDQLLVRIDSECLSSIINNPERNENKSLSKSQQDHDQPHHMQQHSFGRGIESFGAVELDFSSYNHHTSGAVSYANENVQQVFSGGGGGVSLTLGLQQHGGTSGVSLAFSPASQGSLFYPRDHMDDCQPVHYSILDGEGQSLPYRNLMGAQLLHDYPG